MKTLEKGPLSRECWDLSDKTCHDQPNIQFFLLFCFVCNSKWEIRPTNWVSFINCLVNGSTIGCNNKKALDKFELSAAFKPLASSEQLFREKQFDKKLLVKYVCKKLS